MYSVGNVALSVNNFRNLRVARTLVKETAKETIRSGDKSSIAASKSSGNLSYEKNFDKGGKS
jgi:hypothetical protein